VDRRSFIGTLTGGLLATRLAPEAQTAGKTARVGWLALGPNTGPAAAFFDAFREGLRERGWIDGRNLVIEARWGNRDQARDQAAELVQWKPDVLVTQGGPMVFGARAVTGPIPVVFGFSGDPVEGSWSRALPARAGASPGSRSCSSS
jgi:putative ABC transport system substrate-binding protein